MQRLFDIAPTIDIGTAAATFARDGRVQIRDFLTAPCAHAIRRILASETPWRTAWQAGTGGPSSMRREELRAMSPEQRAGRGGQYRCGRAGLCVPVRALSDDPRLSPGMAAGWAA